MTERDDSVDRVSARVELVGGSPLLRIDGTPVAWCENWIPVDPAPELSVREVALIESRLRLRA